MWHSCKFSGARATRAKDGMCTFRTRLQPLLKIMNMSQNQANTMMTAELDQITALEDAIYDKQLEKVIDFLDNNPGLSQTQLDVALAWAVGVDGDIRAITPLFAHGAKINSLAFDYAFVKGDLFVWQAFIDQGWDINSLEYGDPALRCVKFRQSEKFLLAVLMQYHRSVIHSKEDVKWFLDHGADPNLRGARGISPLRAATNNPPEIAIAVIDLLLSHGAELDPEALFAAMTPGGRGGIPVVKYLVAKGIDVNVVLPKRAKKGCGINSRTPLYYAVRCKSKELVEFFLEQGADKELNPNGGISVTEYAKSREYTELLELLGRHENAET